MIRNDTTLSRIFDVCNAIFLALFAITTILPFIYVLGSSFATEREIQEKAFFLIPTEFQFESYKYIFSSATLPRAFLVSVGITLVGTITAMFFTLTFAYPLSKKYLSGRSVILALVTFTLVFGGGMIPTFITIKNYGLLNNYLAIIIPGALSTWNLIIVKNFFQEIPQELEDSARVDGCSDIGTFLKIVLPLSMPVIATFSLFYAVGYWNDYRASLLYLTDFKKWPLQIMLRQIVILASGNIDGAAFDAEYTKPPAASVRSAVIIFGTVPILLVYPFLQKHFTKGVMVGAIKG